MLGPCWVRAPDGDGDIANDSKLSQDTNPGAGPVNSGPIMPSNRLLFVKDHQNTMAKLGILATITAIVGALTFAGMSAPDAADAPCLRKDFKTELVKAACVKGGQKAAKEAMKAFNKDKKIKSCNQCHTKLAPGYELKADAVEQFKKLGGK